MFEDFDFIVNKKCHYKDFEKMVGNSSQSSETWSSYVRSMAQNSIADAFNFSPDRDMPVKYTPNTTSKEKIVRTSEQIKDIIKFFW